MSKLYLKLPIFLFVFIINLPLWAQRSSSEFSDHNSVYYKNEGQVQYQNENFNNKEILYYATDSEGAFYITPYSVIYVQQAFQDSTLFTHRVDVEFSGSKTPTHITSLDESAHINYYKGAKDGVHVQSTPEFTLHNIYQNIDVKYYFEKGQLKYDFIVHPGGNPKDITLIYKGQDELKLEDSKIGIATSMGKIYEEAPFTYQSEKLIPSSYKIKENKVSFKVGKYNRKETLVIDPTRVWSTYFGGSNTDIIESTPSTDAAGNVYLAGYTFSKDIPILGGSQSTPGSNNSIDAFVVRYNQDGTRIWSTYFGSASFEFLQGGTAFDGQNLYIAGQNFSGVLPGAINGRNNGPEGFVAKFNAATGNLAWSIYVGGSDTDALKGGIVVHGSSFYVQGNTRSTDLPTTGASFQPNLSIAGSFDAFLAKYDTSGTHIWTTYLGGTDSENFQGSILYNSAHEITVVGLTESSDFPTLNAYDDSYNGGDDLYISTFDTNGNLMSSTFFGGSDDENVAQSIFESDTTTLFFSGETHSSDLPVTNSTVLSGSADGYLVGFNTTDQSLVYSGYYGGSGADGLVGGVGYKSDSSIIAMGYSQSSDLSPTADAFQSALSGASDFMILILDTAFNTEYLSYYGGSDDEIQVRGIAVDADDRFTFVGYANTANYPTQNADISVAPGSIDGVITQFGFCPEGSSLVTAHDSDTVNTCPNVLTVALNGSTTEPTLALTWSQINGLPATISSPNTGATSVTLDASSVVGNSAQFVLTGSNGICDFSDTVTVVVFDTTAPTPIAYTNTIVYLDNNGSAIITGSDLDSSSTDNCSGSIVGFNAFPNSFSCADTGANTVQFIATDMAGLSDTVNALVTVLDTNSPSVVGHDTTLYLDATGQVILSVEDVVVSTTGTCALVDTLLSQDTFTCADLGTSNLITLSVISQGGTVSTDQVNISVYDTIAPLFQSIPNTDTIYLDANGFATAHIDSFQVNAIDNCSGINVTDSLSDTNFNCSDRGQLRFLTYFSSDASGNISSITVSQMVLDTTAPWARAYDTIDVYLDNNGNAAITVNDIDSASSDNCSAISALTIDVNQFNCSHVGTLQMVTLTAIDSSNNVSTAQTVVNVYDTLGPTLVTQSVDVYIDANGADTISASDFNLGSFDNCTDSNLITFSIADSIFGCTDLGTDTIVLTATDEYGNANSVIVTVNVYDILPPTPVYHSVYDIYLGSNGLATITPNQIDNGSTDQCSNNITFGLSQTQFNCNDIGTMPVQFTVTDDYNNDTTVNVFVTVYDTISADIHTRNITVQLDQNGMVVIQPSDIDSATTDVCNTLSFSLSQDTFTCTDLGQNTVWLIVNDGSSNDSASAVVTVEDNLAPVITPQVETVYLDANGLATISTANLMGWAVDNCTITNVTVSDSNITCNDGMSTQRWVYFEDFSGNIDSSIFTVEILDTIAPTLACLNDTAFCEGVYNFIEPGYFDNALCQTTLTRLGGFDSGDFAEAGTYVVQYIAEDAWGNMATCTQTIDVHALPEVELGNDTVVGQYYLMEFDLVNPSGTGYTWFPTADNSGSVDFQITSDVIIGVVATDSNTGCQNSDQRRVEVILNTGDLTDRALSVNIFPNPSKDNFVIEFNEDLPQDATLSIYNLTGQVIARYNYLDVVENKIRIDNSEWASGTYSLVLNGSNVSLKAKIVKM